MSTTSERITAEVTSWPSVEAGFGDRGEFGFRVGRKEIGHLHGDRVLHSGFPKAVWIELFEQGRIGYHPVFPGRSGYASRASTTSRHPRSARARVSASPNPREAPVTIPCIRRPRPERRGAPPRGRS